MKVTEREEKKKRLGYNKKFVATEGVQNTYLLTATVVYEQEQKRTVITCLQYMQFLSLARLNL